jgi:hypothetical protein
MRLMRWSRRWDLLLYLGGAYKVHPPSGDTTVHVAPGAWWKARLKPDDIDHILVRGTDTCPRLRPGRRGGRDVLPSLRGGDHHSPRQALPQMSRKKGSTALNQALLKKISCEPDPESDRLVRESVVPLFG